MFTCVTSCNGVSLGITTGQRAYPQVGRGANRPQAAVYPTSEGPDVLQSYDGTKKYVMHFPKGQTPPVKGFWSLTMYDADYFFVANPLNRYLLNSPMLPQFKRDADGGLTLHIQHESPGKEWAANWLPAPKGPFFMAMRIYWPKEEALTGKWKQPALKRTE